MTDLLVRRFDSNPEVAAAWGEALYALWFPNQLYVSTTGFNPIGTRTRAIASCIPFEEIFGHTFVTSESYFLLSACEPRTTLDSPPSPKRDH